MITAIVGINWGDEGKGRMVDMLAEKQDIVCRYQGGNNAGHTVVNPFGKFVLNLIPCGIFHKGVVNILGGGMVVDLQHLWGEIESLRERGIEITPDNLMISHRATILMPWDVAQDKLEEGRLKDAKYGSTNRGIAPIYGDKYMKKSLRAGDLLHPEYMKSTLKGLVEWKNLTIERVYDAEPFSYEAMLEWLENYGGKLKDFIKNTDEYLYDAHKAGKDIMFEAQLAALRDIDYGIYPYTTSSNTIAAYGPIGAGIPGARVDMVVGVVKSFSTCVGEGPFAVELFGEEAEKLRRSTGEYGAATGRPRRVGPFDAVATRYGTRVQGADYLVLTKLDNLDEQEKIRVCVAYDVDGERVENFPTGEALNKAKPIYEEMPGWKCDITGCRKPSDLPKEALDYIKFVEKVCDCPIKYVSVGPEREAYIEMY